MPTRISTSRNEYRCSIERNHSGKYCVRLRVYYPRHAWTLNVYFLASSFDRDRKSTRLNSSHVEISYAVFCLKKKKRLIVLRPDAESDRNTSTADFIRLTPVAWLLP